MSNKDNVTSMLARSKLVHMNTDSRSSAIAHSLSTIKSRHTNGLTHGLTGHGQSHLESSITKLKNSTLNGSASTSVLRSNHSIINIRNSVKENSSKNLSTNKFGKKPHSKEKSARGAHY